jgi:hypothetical protein
VPDFNDERKEEEAMRKLLRNLILGGVGMSMLAACSADSVNDEMNTLNASASIVEVQDLSMGDLVGRWTMHSMTSVGTDEMAAVPVDFDQDGVFTYDLLKETDCFDTMYFEFDNQGKVNTHQSRLYFGSTGEFTCQTTGDYAATYQISGNDLSVTFTVDGFQYTETKTINRYSENGIEFLMVTLTKAETNGAVYVANDPGNTVASELQKIEIVYKKA